MGTQEYSWGLRRVGSKCINEINVQSIASGESFLFPFWIDAKKGISEGFLYKYIYSN